MCGIAGILRFDDEGVEVEDLERLCAALTHRGPDDHGVWSDGPIGLAHTRLSILDPTPAGHQPMLGPAGEVVVVYNGELYNTPALRTMLQGQGERLRTGTDTELLPLLWRRYGPEMLRFLRGMFAFAVWDRRDRTLFMARDRFGQKPLYYVRLHNELLFASELKALCALERFPRRIDLGSLREYLAFGYVPDGATIYKDVRKLPPAHVIRLDRHGLGREKRYWAHRFDPEEGRSEDEWIAELESKLEETVHAHMISDVPLGAFLSGGVDSSTVVALMARHGGRVKTFSIGFEELDHSEIEHARSVAQSLGTDHTELIVRPDKAHVIEKLAEIYDEPFADSSALPTYVVSELTRGYVTVALTGDGGDEIFGGYLRYFATLAALERRFSGALGWVERAGAAFGAALWPTRFRGGGTLDRLAAEDGNYCDGWLTIFGRRIGAWSLSPEFFGPFDPVERVESIVTNTAASSLVQRFQMADVRTYLPGDILVKVDRASMAVSLETRAPFLDHELAEFAGRIPSRLLTSAQEGKILLKKLARKLVPASAVDRPKQGFGLPVAAWFRGELAGLVDDTILVPQAQVRKLLRPGAIEKLVGQHRSGRFDRSSQIWSLVMLELFFRRWKPSGL